MDDWQRILIGDDRSWTFLLETAGRSVFMCVVLLLLFKLTGKKEVRQFSVLELIVIIGRECQAPPTSRSMLGRWWGQGRAR